MAQIDPISIGLAVTALANPNNASTYATAAQSSANTATTAANALTTAAINQVFFSDYWPGFGSTPSILILDSTLNLVYSTTDTVSKLTDLISRIGIIEGKTSLTVIEDYWPGAAANVYFVDPAGKLLSDGSSSGGSGAISTASIEGATFDSNTFLSVPNKITNSGSVIYLFLVWGQSLSISAGSYVAKVFTSQSVASSQPWANNIYMPSVGVWPDGRAWSNAIPAYEQMYAHNGIDYVGETGWVRCMSRIWERVYNATGKSINLGIAVSGVGGTRLANLSRGTPNWEGMKTNVQNFVQWATPLGKTVIVAGIIDEHGNADTGLFSSLQYNLGTYRNVERANQELKLITGQSQDIPWFMQQTLVSTGVSSATNNVFAESGVAQAQLDMCFQHDGIRFVGGGTSTDHPDGTHRDSLNYLWAHELIGEDIADDLFLNGLVTPAVYDHWRTGASTWRFKVGAPYTASFDLSNKIVQSAGIPGLYGWQFDDGTGTSAPTITSLVVNSTENGSVNRGMAFVDMTLSATPQQYGDYRLGIGLQAQGGTGDGYNAVAHAVVNTSDGGIDSIVIDNAGNSWTTVPEVIISGAGTGATATATISGGVVTAVNVTNRGSGYGGTQTYVCLMRGAAGRYKGCRNLLSFARGAFSSYGWDGLPAATTANPRPLYNYAARQHIHLKK